MKRIKNRLSVAAAVVLFFSSCTKDHGSGSGNNAGNNAGPLFLDVKTIMQANCAVSGCHAGPNPQDGIDLSVDATIIAEKAAIKARAVDAAGTPTQMPLPPRAPLSAADQKKIIDWIGAGGKLSD